MDGLVCVLAEEVGFEVDLPRFELALEVFVAVLAGEVGFFASVPGLAGTPAGVSVMVFVVTVVVVVVRVVVVNGDEVDA